MAALVHEMGGRVRYDYQPNAKPTGPQGLRMQLGRHFFDDVSSCAVAQGSGERRIAIVWTDESPKVAPWPHASERGSSGAEGWPPTLNANGDSCVWLGWKIERARKQREAVAWVQELGGELSCDSESPGPQWLRKRLGRHFFDDVVRV